MKRLLLAISLLCLLFVANAQVDRYPNIQSPAQTSVIIAWTSASAYVGTVHWGSSAGSLTNVLTEASSGKDHAITISGLQPNTQYYYQASGGSFTSSVENFFTAKPDSIHQMDFVVFGDCGFNSSQQDQIAALMAAQPVDFGIILGDVDQIVGNDYDNNYFSHYKNTLARKCYFTAIGNHDVLTNGTNYTDAFHLPHNNPANSEKYYSFTWGNAKFITIDGNSDYTQGSAQYTWLENELKCQDHEWVFVYFHQPPWTNGWSVIYYVPLQPFFMYEGNTDMRTSIVPLFERYHVDFVMNGHAHDYQRGTYHGVQYVITGGGGTPASDNIHTNNNSPNIQFEYDPDNYMKFSINGDTARYYTYDINGNIFDSLKITKTYTPFDTTLTLTDPKCPGDANGRAVISATGQNPPFTYAWSTGGSSNVISSVAAGAYEVSVTDGVGCVRTGTAVLHDPQPVVGVAAVTDVACNGGTNGAISLSVSGGTLPYYYTWSTSDTTSIITNHGVGLYSAIIKDNNGCPDTVSAAITEPPALIDSISATNALCVGDSSGAVNVVVSGGALPYSFHWSTGDSTQNISHITGGSYSVSITDAHGCTKTDNVTILQSRLLLQDAVVNETCPGAANGHVALSASGGIAPYQYAWSNGANPLALTAGSYTVSATDANLCSTTKTYDITTLGGNQRPTLTGETLVCKGDSVRIAATTGFSAYNWNTAATTATIYTTIAGTYYVAATDSFGCVTNSDTLQVVADSVPHLQLTGNVVGYTVQLGASQTGAGTYAWTFGNGQTLTDSLSYTDYTYADTGAYKIILVTHYRCGNDTASITVHIADSTTGILYLAGNEINLQLQPNPFHDATTLSMEHKADEGLQVKLFDLAGKLLRDYGNNLSKTLTIQRGNISAGVYVLDITGKQVHTSLRLVVE